MELQLNNRKIAIFGCNKKDVQVMFIRNVMGKDLLMYDGPALGCSETTQMMRLWDDCDDETLIDSCLEVVDVD